MRPQNKKHKTFFTHRQQKIPRTKPQKKKNKQQQNNHYLLLLFYRIRVHYTVLTQHTTPHTTPNHMRPKNQWATTSKRSCLIRGDSIEQQPCCPRHPTACHTNKTNHQNTNTLIFVSLIPHTRKNHVRDLFHLKTKTATTSRLNQTQNNDEKLATNQILTSTQPATKQNNYILLRKEVIQPHLPVRLPCYDFVPIANPTFDHSPHQKVVRPWASGVTNFHDVTGGVYKARERIHRSIADLRLLATPTSWGRVADPNPN